MKQALLCALVLCLAVTSVSAKPAEYEFVKTFVKGLKLEEEEAASSVAGNEELRVGEVGEKEFTSQLQELNNANEEDAPNAKVSERLMTSETRPPKLPLHRNKQLAILCELRGSVKFCSNQSRAASIRCHFCPTHACNVRIYRVSTSCLLYTSPSPRDLSTSRMPSSA